VPATHTVHVLAPALERFPAPHVEQVLDPWVENLPAIQIAQTPGDDAPGNAEAVPAVQFVQREEPWVLANLPAEQVRHVLFDVANGVADDFPAEHGEHMFSPAVV